MSLVQKQDEFAGMVALLIQQARSLGYQVSLGEAWRTPEQATANAVTGKGTRDSLHISRLAIDLNLFRNGVYLQATGDHRELGEWWENLDPRCRWGGRFKRPDGNHYSFEHEGRA